jgi:hypothetical protein
LCEAQRFGAPLPRNGRAWLSSLRLGRLFMGAPLRELYCGNFVPFGAERMHK